MNKLLLLCFLFLAPVSLASADLKIAVVNLSKVFDAYYKTKDADSRLKEKEQGYTKDVADMKADYSRMVDEANKLRDASQDPTLSPTAQADKKKAFVAKAQDVENMQRKMQETVNERRGELQDESMRRRREIVAEISKVVNDYSVPQGFDLVFDTSQTATGVPVVLYSSSKMTDITNDIITKLNAGAPPAGAAPAPSGGSAPAPAH